VPPLIDSTSLPTPDFSVWWDLAGRAYAPVLAAAIVATAIAVGMARLCIREKTGETSKRAWTRTWVLAAVSAALSVGGVVAAYAVFFTFHTHVGVFFFAVGVAFWTSAVLVPGYVLLTALRAKSWSRAAAAAAVLALAAWMLFVEPNRVGVIEATVKLDALPRGCSLRVAHLSDIQTLAFGGREERALELANAFDPDLVVITGDLTASGQHPVLVAHLRDWLRRLKSRTSRYVVNGDSDPNFDALVAGMPEVTYLKDSGVAVDVQGARLWICGLDNLRRPPDAQRAFAGAPEGAVKLFLAHNPDYFLSKTDSRAAFGFAGHTHGGQVHIPWIGPLVTFTFLGPKYAEGVYTRGDLEPRYPWNVEQMSVCPGIGMEGGYAPRVRFLCPPRLVLLTLENEAAPAVNSPGGANRGSSGNAR
jgi:predicted MPP superfamily phosphohydrolase